MLLFPINKPSTVFIFVFSSSLFPHTSCNLECHYNSLDTTLQAVQGEEWRGTGEGGREGETGQVLEHSVVSTPGMLVASAPPDCS